MAGLVRSMSEAADCRTTAKKAGVRLRTTQRREETTHNCLAREEVSQSTNRRAIRS